MDTNIYLFIGVMATILGFSLIVYAIILYIAYRRKAKRYVGNIDVVSVREWEADLQLTAPMTSTPTPAISSVSNPFDVLSSTTTTTNSTFTPTQNITPSPVLSAPTTPQTIAPTNTPARVPVSTSAASHHQVLVALEQLVKQHHMGLIDDISYQQRKTELFDQLAGISGTVVPTAKTDDSDEPKTYATYEELVVDFTEGIITAKEFEQYKAQFNQ